MGRPNSETPMRLVRKLLIIIFLVSAFAGASYYSYQEGLYTGAQLGFDYGVAVTQFQYELDAAAEAAKPCTCTL